MEETKVRPTNKPLSMKLFSTWEGERTAPHCIPRTCTFKLQSLKLTKPLDLESSITICASMSVGNFRRSLRTDEIFPNKQGIADLDYCFSFQYPHYLKREENVLKLSLQRRKRYRNRTILGYKTVAIGRIDLAQVMQCPFDDVLKLFAKGGGFQIAQLRLHQLTSIPHESIRNHSGENSSTEEDDQDMFFASDDDLDSEGEERITNKKKPKIKDSLKLNKKFGALLRKMKLNDDVELAPLHEDDDPAILPPEEFSQTFSSILAGISDESVNSDSDSIGTLPKPHLRPYFTADFDDDMNDLHDPSPVEKGSSTDEGVITTKKKDPVTKNNKRPSQCSPTVMVKSTRSVSQCSTPSGLIGDIRGNNTDHSRVARSDESCEVSRSSPTRHSPNSQHSSDSGDMSNGQHKYRSSSQDAEDHSIAEQMSIMFNKQDSIPTNIMLCFYKDRVHHPLMKSMSLATYNQCVFIQNSSDAKFFMSTLVNKMQKFVNRHSSMPSVNLTVIGDFAASNMIVKPITDCLSNKGSEWIQNFKFIFVATDLDNPICTYISSIDPTYHQLIAALNNCDVCDISLLSSYQNDVNETVKLSIGRVLLSQTTDDEQKDTKPFELPFLHSVTVELRRESCASCEAVKLAEEAERCKDHELDFQVDYSTPNKKDATSKQQQLKGIFRELGVYRDLAEQHESLTLRASYREKKPKVALKLNKKSDLIGIQCVVNNFTCMSKSSTVSSFTVHVDGVEIKNVTTFFIFPVWSQHLNYIPVSVRGAPTGVLC